MRRARFAPLLLPLLIAGCGSETRDATQTASLTLALLETSDPEMSSSATLSKSTPQISYINADCDTGVVTQLAGQSQVNSPYSNSPYLVLSYSADGCGFAYSISADRIDSSGAQTLDGSLAYGVSSDGNGDYSYFRIGSSAANPAVLAVQATTTFRGDGSSFTVDGELTESLYMRLDHAEYASSSNSRLTLSQQGGFVTTTSGDGSREGAYSLEIGTSSAPFVFGRSSAGLSFAGRLLFSLDREKIPGDCGFARLDVETLTPLKLSGDSDQPYASGELQVTKEDGTQIQVVFNGSGSVTVSDDSSSRTLSYAALMAQSNDCVSAVSTAALARSGG